MNTIDLDLVIIGGGPAGMAAAVEAKKLGIKDLLLIERDERLGGILPQCIHSGFGMDQFREELTGPEYANRYVKMLERSTVDVELNTLVLELDKERSIVAVSEKGGVKRYRCRSVILAMGCRERTRGALGIPGTRPAGIFTAGKAQRLLNIEGYLPGRKIIILGSGDIGMIMARRLTLEGAEVKAVVEILPYAGGLIRNEVQCLHDFGIPLLLNHTVSEIHGDRRIEGVTIVKVDGERNLIRGTEQFIECDTLLLSVGLIPENELSKMAEILIDPSIGGPFVDNHLETSVPGIFSCGNVLHVNDIVDDVSREGEMAARGAWARMIGKGIDMDERVALETDSSLKQVVPQWVRDRREVTLSMRVTRPIGKMRIHVGEQFSKKFTYARPSEMIRMRLPGKMISETDLTKKKLELWCEEEA